MAPFAAAAAPPQEPMITLSRLRFMALHIKMVNNVPAAPTSIPPVSIAWLLYIKPPQAAATPVKELRSDITTGISAPPIGITNKTPYTNARASTP